MDNWALNNCKLAFQFTGGARIHHINNQYLLNLPADTTLILVQPVYEQVHCFRASIHSCRI